MRTATRKRARRISSGARAAAASSTAPSGDPPLVALILDGENPWEAYPGSGESFLRALFTGLARDADMAPVSVGEHLRAARSRRPLEQLHSGSWIDSDFHIWIGDPVKNRAWDLLGRTRRVFERAKKSAPPARVEEAFEHLLAAEGSDWFWWFGAPFSSAEDHIFDRLFRAHLAGVLRALDEPLPDELDRPIAPSAPSAARAPFAFIHPRIEAERAPSFYEWHGAGVFEVPRGAAMAETPLVSTVRFGFDRVTFYLRLDPATPQALDGCALEIDFEITHEDRARKLRLRSHDARGWQLSDGGAAAEGGPAAFTRGIAVGVPFARLGAAPGDRVELAIRVVRGELPVTRLPADGAIVLTVPDDAFEAANWWA
jgi:hypothetical protein